MPENNSPKFAFYYMLSLVALVFMALSAGVIIFQIINKNIADVINQDAGRYSPELLKFAISALFFSAPVYFLTMRAISKNLAAGALRADAGVRKWLTYFILFVSSVVMLVWLIVTLNSFLSGELTGKFILKAVTAIGISAVIFTYYYYDIKREEIAGKRDKMISAYFYGSLAAVIIVFVASLFFVESPTATRNRIMDENIIDNFSQLEGTISSYYRAYGRLPENMAALREKFSYVTGEITSDPATGEEFGYNVLDDKMYELCGTFKTSTRDADKTNHRFYNDHWLHDAGYQCLKQTVMGVSEGGVKPIPAPVQ